LMWEIFAGHSPFDDRGHDHRLIFDICEEGLRPPILPGIPEDYSQMMQKCWDVDPSKRPTMRKLWIFADEKLKEISNSSNDNDDDTTLPQLHKSHPSAYHTSRILNDEIAKSKKFQK